MIRTGRPILGENHEMAESPRLIIIIHDSTRLKFVKTSGGTKIILPDGADVVADDADHWYSEMQNPFSYVKSVNCDFKRITTLYSKSLLVRT